MANLNSAQGRLSMMLVLTTLFFIVEIIVGYITNSMALIADSFHMFSDAIALVIAFISVRMSPKKWSKNTFGWARAEILGALVNAVFLCALCVSILIESIKRFVKPDVLHDPSLLLIVGSLGLFINLIGLLLFKGHHHHHHHHHGHGHHHHHEPASAEDEYLVGSIGDNRLERSHKVDQSDDKLKYGLLCEHDHKGSQDLLYNTTASRHSHTPSPDNHLDDDNDEKQLTKTKSSSDDIGKQQSSLDLRHTKVNIATAQGSSSHNQEAALSDVKLAFRPAASSRHQDHGCGGGSSNLKNDHGDHHHHHHHHHVDLGAEAGQDQPKKHQTSNQMNMHGVFLHVMADALGSVIVMISALVFLYTDWETVKLYIDPTLSVFMVCLILRSTWPLLTESAMILLQTVPTHIEVDSLRRRLIREIPGVLAVHEFHVWQLAGDRIIASAHIRCHNLQDYMRIAEKVKEFFHNEGIHSTTIQPEFLDLENQVFNNDTGDNCVLDCPPTQRPHCAPQTCCGNQQRAGNEPTGVAIEGSEQVSSADQAGVSLSRRTNVKAQHSVGEATGGDNPLNSSDSADIVNSASTSV